jgi:hypothetical protein
METAPGVDGAAQVRFHDLAIDDVFTSRDQHDGLVLRWISNPLWHARYEIRFTSDERSIRPWLLTPFAA